MRRNLTYMGKEEGLLLDSRIDFKSVGSRMTSALAYSRLTNLLWYKAEKRSPPDITYRDFVEYINGTSIQRFGSVEIAIHRTVRGMGTKTSRAIVEHLREKGFETFFNRPLYLEIKTKNKNDEQISTNPDILEKEIDPKEIHIFVTRKGLARGMGSRIENLLINNMPYDAMDRRITYHFAVDTYNTMIRNVRLPYNRNYGKKTRDLLGEFLREAGLGPFLTKSQK